MKKFTVWFRIGMDFKETIEAEDVHDAQRRIYRKVDDEYPDYMAEVQENYSTFVHDIVEGVPDE